MMLEGCQGKPRTPTIHEKICPQCGSVIEMFSIDTQMPCEKCGFVAYNDSLSCVQWCQYARKCVGDEMYEQMMKIAAQQKKNKGGSGMIRRIIQIDEEKCNGCGLCASACHEGAIGMVGGKAKLLRDDYCDGLGDCLPACPTGAISFVHREAAEYNEAAVMAAKAASRHSGTQPETATWLPGQLQNFPVQLKLVPSVAPWFYGADLLIAADCTAFSYGNFHNDFIRGKVTLIGCPKLDGVQYAEKLTQILQNNEIRSVTVTRMTVPCCGGLTWAVQQALERSGKQIPLRIVTISPDGKIASDVQ